MRAERSPGTQGSAVRQSLACIWEVGIRLEAIKRSALSNRGHNIVLEVIRRLGDVWRCQKSSRLPAAPDRSHEADVCLHSISISGGDGV